MENQNSFKGKKGSAILVYFMIGIVFFFLALALSNPLKEVVTGENVMGANGLNCSSDLISNQNKAICTGLDIMSPIFIATIFGLGGILISKVLL